MGTRIFLLLLTSTLPLATRAHFLTQKNEFYQTVEEESGQSNSLTTDGRDTSRNNAVSTGYTDEEMSVCVDQLRSQGNKETVTEITDDICQPYSGIIVQVLELLKARNLTYRQQYKDLVGNISDHFVYRDCFERVLVNLERMRNTGSVHEYEKSGRQGKFFTQDFNLKGLVDKYENSFKRYFNTDNDYYRRCYRRRGKNERYEDDRYWDDDRYKEDRYERRCCGRYDFCNICPGDYTQDCCRDFCEFAELDSEYARYGCWYDRNYKSGRNYCSRNRRLEFCRRCRHCKCYLYDRYRK